MLTGVCRTSKLVFILGNLPWSSCPMGVCCVLIWNLHLPKTEIKQLFVSNTSRQNVWLEKHQIPEWILTHWYGNAGRKGPVSFRQKPVVVSIFPVYPIFIPRIRDFWCFPLIKLLAKWTNEVSTWSKMVSLHHGPLQLILFTILFFFIPFLNIIFPVLLKWFWQQRNSNSLFLCSVNFWLAEVFPPSWYLFMWQLLKASIWWTKTTKTDPNPNSDAVVQPGEEEGMDDW